MNTANLTVTRGDDIGTSIVTIENRGSFQSIELTPEAARAIATELSLFASAKEASLDDPMSSIKALLASDYLEDLTDQLEDLILDPNRSASIVEIKQNKA